MLHGVLPRKPPHSSLPPWGDTGKHLSASPPVAGQLQRLRRVRLRGRAAYGPNHNTIEDK